MKFDGFGPGTYYLGDPCYVLNNHIYYNVWGNEHNYEEGIITVVHEGQEHCFAVARTCYGDGEYLDQNRKGYPVDSGTIALIPFALWEKGLTATDIVEKFLGNVLKAKDSVVFSAEDGVFEVLVDKEKIMIDTKQEELVLEDEDFDDEDFEEDEENYYDDDEDEEDMGDDDQDW